MEMFYYMADHPRVGQSRSCHMVWVDDERYRISVLTGYPRTFLGSKPVAGTAVGDGPTKQLPRWWIAP